ncbi:hypothetical protein CLOSCI_03148 [[Clostridium] scindens ATCC 35704]|nr:hypothetical protein CLOSCI_03148 [[Clostridium] scindens ATCC 35704]
MFLFWLIISHILIWIFNMFYQICELTIGIPCTFMGLLDHKSNYNSKGE